MTTAPFVGVYIFLLTTVQTGLTGRLLLKEPHREGGRTTAPFVGVDIFLKTTVQTGLTGGLQPEEP